MLHSTEFPGETAEYRRARKKLLQAELKLRRQIETVAKERRALPLGGRVSEDYIFDSSSPGETGFRTTRLSQLFAPGKRSLFLYNFMFPDAIGSMTPCPSCSSIIDAVDGASRHVIQRINLAVIAKAPIDEFRAHANRRRVTHFSPRRPRTLSTAITTPRTRMASSGTWRTIGAKQTVYATLGLDREHETVAVLRRKARRDRNQRSASV